MAKEALDLALAEAKLSASQLWGLCGDDPEDQLGHFGINKVDALLVERRRSELADLFELQDDLVDGLVLGQVAFNVLNEELTALAGGIKGGGGGFDLLVFCL